MRTDFAEKDIQELEPAVDIDQQEQQSARDYLFLFISSLGTAHYEIIQYDKSYIDILLCVENYWYYYDQDMTVKNIGIVCLINLDNAINYLRILNVSHEVLADYLEKAAVIFQTASDKTRMTPEDARETYRGIWKEKAQQYSREAFRIRNQKEQDISHETRMLELYRKFSEQEGFAQKYLQHRYCEYRDQCETANQTAHANASDENPDLRYRHGFRFSDSGTAEAAETMSPLLTPTAPT